MLHKNLTPSESKRLPTATIYTYPDPHQTGAYYPALCYIAAQVLHGRGEIAYIAGEGLIYHLTLEPWEKEKFFFSDLEEIWVVLDLERED